MAIIPVGTAYAAGDTVAMPEHLPGDTIIVFVSRSGSAAPALQAGWTNIVNGNRAVGTGNWSGRVAAKVAASSSETVGTWPTTEQMLVLVYRNVSQIGVVTTQIGAANKTVSYPAATLQAADGQSWVVRLARGGGAASLTTDLLTEAPIAGYAIRAGNDAILAMDTAAPTATNPVVQTQVTLNTNYWWAITLELRAAPAGGFFGFF